MPLPRLQHGREIFRLASPTVITMLSHTLMWTVDSAFLGRVSSLALGAAGLGGLITWNLYSLFNNLSRISATFVSQANGRGDDEAVGDYTWQACYLALVAGALLTLVGYHSDLLLPLTKNGPEIEGATYIYIKWRMVSAVATQLAFSVGGFFQGRKDVTTPMWAGVIANGLNVGLDYALIFGWPSLGLPPLGIKGAAIATSIASVVQIAILFGAMLGPRELRRRYAVHRPRPPQLRQLREIVRVGLPSCVYGVLDMSFFTFFTVLVGRAGTAALAASQITVQLLSFSFMPLFGLSQAATVLVGNAMGERAPERAERYAVEVYLIALGYGLLLAFCLAMFGEHLFVLFTKDPAVLGLAGSLALVAAVFQLFDGGQIVGSGILTGAGDTRFPAVYSLLVLWLLGVPSIYLVMQVAGGSVVQGWAASAVCYAVIALGLYLRVRGGRWKQTKIFDDAPLPQTGR